MCLKFKTIANPLTLPYDQSHHFVPLNYATFLLGREHSSRITVVLAGRFAQLNYPHDLTHFWMTRIICDTMVWYELAKGRIQIPDTERYQLVCTHLSLMEIACSSNNFNKLNEVQSVVSKILSLEPEIITQQPYGYARSRVDNDQLIPKQTDPLFCWRDLKFHSLYCQ